MAVRVSRWPAPRSRPDDDAPALEHRLSLLGVQPVLQAIEMLAAWDGQTPLGTRQDAALATRAPRLKKSHGEVDWSQTASSIVNQVRALRPWPGTYTQWLRTRHPLHLLLEQVSVDDLASPTAGVAPGCVVRVDGQVITVATGQGMPGDPPAQAGGQTRDGRRRIPPRLSGPGRGSIRDLGERQLAVVPLSIRSASSGMNFAARSPPSDQNPAQQGGEFPLARNGPAV